MGKGMDKSEATVREGKTCQVACEEHLLRCFRILWISHEPAEVLADKRNRGKSKPFCNDRAILRYVGFDRMGQGITSCFSRDLLGDKCKQFGVKENALRDKMRCAPQHHLDFVFTV